MAATTTKKKKSNLILARNMRDYSEEPVFKKKAEEAKLVGYILSIHSLAL